MSTYGSCIRSHDNRRSTASLGGLPNPNQGRPNYLKWGNDHHRPTIFLHVQPFFWDSRLACHHQYGYCAGMPSVLLDSKTS